MRYRSVLARSAVAATLCAAPPVALPAAPAAGVGAAPSTAFVAARIAGQLGCRAFEYVPGPAAASASAGQLSCRLVAQDVIVYVFASNRDRAMGIAHTKLWSGPADDYYFARTRRAIVVPAGGWNGPVYAPVYAPAYTEAWARIAADRTGGAVYWG